MHYLHNLLSASGASLSPWTPLGDFRPQTPNLRTPGKNPAGAHDYDKSLLRLTKEN